MIERARSRNRNINSRSQEYPYEEVEVKGVSLSPSRKYSDADDIQPKIGHYYSRSPSPQLRSRPTTSRSASRNAMTQVDEDFVQRSKAGGRSSPPPRGYIEISGRESRAASRAEMKPSMTAPNLNEYVSENNNQERRPSYSRHYDHNGHHQRYAAKYTNGHNDSGHGGRAAGGLRNSTSLSLLPLARDANFISFRDKYNRPGSDWNLTTTKRSYRYNQVRLAYNHIGHSKHFPPRKPYIPFWSLFITT